MTRTHLWQLATIAAATGLLCVAQAQTGAAAQDSADAFAVPAKFADSAPSEADVLAVIATDTAATSRADASDTAQPANDAATPMAPPKSVHAAAVIPTAAAPLPAVVAEPPITREEVVAEAIYANQHGLIPRGEMGMVNEDKGTYWVEQAESARMARAEQVRVARIEAYQQRLARAAVPAPVADAPVQPVPQQVAQR